MTTLAFRDGSVMPPPSDAEIASFEHYYRIRLPRAYVAFLRANNGGVPRGGASFLVGKRERVLERFLSILEDPRSAGAAGWYDISVVWTQIEDRLIEDLDMVGTDILPIAALFGGDFVCLDYRKNPKTPEIVVWDHELSDEGKPHVDFVCASFDEFLPMLKNLKR